MRQLYHFWLSPFSRKVRLVLAEKKLDFQLVAEPVWERREEFLRLNPAGEVPVLQEEDGTIIADSTVICEYIDEVYKDDPLMGSSPVERAEIRRLVAWFDGKFNTEVTDNLLGEKYLKRYFAKGSTPDTGCLRAGRVNVGHHLDYLGWLFERRKWLAGDHLTMADIAAAAQISVIDYMGDIKWSRHERAKEWYMRIKSRPSMREILADRQVGFPPASHYADLDFE
ncbi:MULTISPECIES: glutathione S-transferase family protein [unclassified Thalassospira]|uniref:glutathione S-transferase family protein n=1 Tax=unclassified Thalassospira TaxID=2648997 RepID=UPI000A1F3A50|nr:glutathione S-transferase family protein [Thalassospira sp. MCCC 1A01428]OSQ45912.1 glutathione S-transferase [Thalassospira sp. MCCC 1A01428]